MQHMRIATYEITRGSFPEIADSAKSGLLPKFRTQPGFVRYGVADTGDKSLVSISLWETHEQAEAAAPVAATWVKEHMSDRVALRSNLIGDLAFFQGTATPASV